MGDPTLRLEVTPPPVNLAATSSGSVVTLSWNPSSAATPQYFVYRSTNGIDGLWTKLTSNPYGTTSFTDSAAPSGAKLYQVRALSGHEHKYDDVRCAQFGLWRGARREHPRSGAVTDAQRSHRPNSAQPGGRQVFFGQTSLLAPYRSTAGYARRSRLVWPKNPLPRMYR